MDYRELGGTGLRVSRLGFGGAPIGIPNYLTREARDTDAFHAAAIAALREAVALGITYFDTAWSYGGGRSERLMGEGLEPFRDRVVLATKYPFRPDPAPEQYTEALGASLERLRTDRIDVLQLHGGTFSDELADTILGSGVLDWADAMKGSGRCRALGITAEGPSGGLERLLRTGRFEVIEIGYNLVYQSTCDHQREPSGIVPFARALGMGVTTMRPTTCGFLQKLLAAEFPDIDAARLTRLAIRFVLSTPEIDSVCVGMRHEDEVRLNVALAEDAGSYLDLEALHDRFA
ncbi:aldo/keto reductase [bacterium]|nr:aldo/keto reductase [bacterium]